MQIRMPSADGDINKAKIGVELLLCLNFTTKIWHNLLSGKIEARKGKTNIHIGLLSLA